MKLKTAAAVFAVFLLLGLISLWLARQADSSYILTAVAVTSAFLSALSATAAWATVREMRLERRARERPQVIPRFDIRANSTVYFCLRNLGNGVAREVRVDFSPELEDYHGQPLSSIPIFQNAIAVLEPGDEFCQFFHTTSNVLKGEGPHQTKVTVRYEGAGSRQYTETGEFDLEHYEGTTLPPKGTEEHLKDISDNLKKLERRFRNVTSLRALLVETPDQRLERLNEMARDEPSNPSAVIVRFLQGLWNRILRR